MEGSSRPKEAFRSAAKTTIRKQLGGGRSGTFRRLYTSNTPSRRRVSLPQRTRKRTYKKVPGHHFGSGQTDQREHLGSNGEWAAKVEKRLFREKENQLKPIMARHKKLQAKNAVGTIFSLQSLTQRRDSFSSPYFT